MYSEIAAAMPINKEFSLNAKQVSDSVIQKTLIGPYHTVCKINFSYLEYTYKLYVMLENRTTKHLV